MVLTGSTVAPGLAHPHLWILSQTFIQFNDQGQVVSLRHLWTFDQAFSAWSVQGLDVNSDGEVSSDEMTDLTTTYLEGLSHYDYYTFAGQGDHDIALEDAHKAHMEDRPDGLVMDFTLNLATPVTPNEPFDVAVYDPEFYTAFDYVLTDPVVLVNAPADCSESLAPPTPLPQDVLDRLYDLPPDVTQLPPDLKVAVRNSSYKIRVQCGDAPPAVAATALDAATQLAAAPATAPATVPFAQPAVEKGLPIPRQGILLAVYNLQLEMYKALTGALADMKDNGSAFWVLGLLSFLYGVFHAAGPGHGKVVISSYVLATEQQLLRGVAMSFAASLVQSLVAISFVLVAALLLQMTSVAMSGATQVLVIGAYAMVTLMGLWLIVRHVFGLGHHHHEAHGHHGHDHADHAHGHEDHHVVTARQTGGSFWEMAGVVLSVGARPCSGALVVLVFSLSQGLFLAGIVATLLMGLGTGITVSLLAGFAVAIKQLTQRLGGRASWVGPLTWWVELFGAVLVFAFGLLFLLANI